MSKQAVKTIERMLFEFSLANQIKTHQLFYSAQGSHFGHAQGFGYLY